MGALIFIRPLSVSDSAGNFRPTEYAQRPAASRVPTQIQNRYTTFDNSSPTSIARCAFPKPAVLRAKEERAKCERERKRGRGGESSEIARGEMERKVREEGVGWDRVIARTLCV